ncbi:Trafficking protein particle complex 8 [Cyanidiococcus yangmingshanensis]|uniref:Trafficking protein particle complex 8 n=1 Tax=Cyanidiococcus yangmingshanensis TaxID=2690220 RepID=A0A7J7ILM8_9RHOD|nr:Trafficking protein particle complex 8 [Cyanidiococcus yangmingshanensis]
MISDSISSFLEQRTGPLVLVTATPRGEKVCQETASFLCEELHQGPANLNNLECDGCSALILAKCWLRCVTGTDFRSGGEPDRSSGSSHSRLRACRLTSVQEIREILLLSVKDNLDELVKSRSQRTGNNSLCTSSDQFSRIWLTTVRKEVQQQSLLGNTATAIMDFLSLSPFGLPHHILDQVTAQLIFADANDSSEDIIPILLEHARFDPPLRERILDHDRPVFVVQFARSPAKFSGGNDFIEEELLLGDALRAVRFVLSAPERGESSKLGEQLCTRFLEWIDTVVWRESQSRMDQLERAGRVVRNQFKVWFSSGQAKAREGVVPAQRLGLNLGTMPYVYLWNSAETRAFFLGSLLIMRKSLNEAVAVLRMVVADFRYDRSMVYAAAASESLGIALMLQGKSEISEIMDILSAAADSYRQADKFLDACRVVLLLATACVKENDWLRAGEYLLDAGLSDVNVLRKSRGSVPPSRKLCGALCLELAAVCFQLLRRPKRKRLLQFCLSMAAECYASARFFEDARRLFVQVSDELKGKAWSWVEAFTNLSASRTAWMCSEFLESYKRYCAFLSDLKPSRVDEVAVLKETVMTASILGDRIFECVCAFPPLDLNSIVLAEEFRIFEDTQTQEWKAMADELRVSQDVQLQLCSSSTDGEIAQCASKPEKFSPLFDLFETQEIPVNGCLNVSAGEKVVLTCRLENPLRAPIEVHDVVLEIRRRNESSSDNESRSDGILPIHVETGQGAQIPHNSDGLLRGVFVVPECGIFDIERVNWKVYSPLFNPSLVCCASFDLHGLNDAMLLRRNDIFVRAAPRVPKFCSAIRIGPPAPLLSLRSPNLPKSVFEGQIWKAIVELVNVSLVTVHGVTLCWCSESDFLVHVLRCLTSESEELALKKSNQVVSLGCSLEQRDFIRFELAIWCRHYVVEQSDDSGFVPSFLRFLVLSSTHSPSSTLMKLLPVRLGVLKQKSIQISLCCLREREALETPDGKVQCNETACKRGLDRGALLGFQVQNLISNPCILRLERLQVHDGTSLLRTQNPFNVPLSCVTLQNHDRANIFLYTDFIRSADSGLSLVFPQGLAEDFMKILDIFLALERRKETSETSSRNLTALALWTAKSRCDDSTLVGLSLLDVPQEKLSITGADQVENLEVPRHAEQILTLIPCEHGVNGKLLISTDGNSSPIAHVDEREVASNFAFWSGHVYRAVAARRFITDTNVGAFLVIHDI